MKTANLITLAGLGASVTTAAASPVYGLTDNTPRPILTPRNPNPFQPIKGNSANLYQECTKKIFDNLENPEVIKGGVTGSIEPSKFQLPPLVGTGTVGACLKVHIKHHEDSNRGNVIANIELAGYNGGYGFILLTSISNLGWYSFDHRLLLLGTGDRTWVIKAGIQWQEKLFMEGSKPEKIKWKLPNHTIDVTYWRNMLCDPHTDCEKQMQNKPMVEKKYCFDWPKASSTNMFQALEMQNPATSKPYETDFWNGKEVPLTANSNIVNKPQAVFVNGQWKTTTKLFDGNIKLIQDWFNKFKGGKGVWRDQ